MITTDHRVDSAQEIARAWAAEHSCIDKCDIRLAPTIDHRLILTATSTDQWLELPDGDSAQPISKVERRQILDWLMQYCH
jgi:hypothetical protein